MKFHIQLKAPGLSANDMRAKLCGKGFNLRPMRCELWESKWKITNCDFDCNILFDEERVEIQGGGDYNTSSFIGFIAGQLGIKKPITRHTKSDIGYERHGWKPSRH